MSRLNYSQLATEIHANSLKHGWWEDKPSMEHFLTLIVCELAEAVEADRIGKVADITSFEQRIQEPPSEHEAATYQQRYAYWFETYIKDTVADELADAAIRLLDLAGACNCNTNRVCLIYVVTKLNSFTENIFAIMKDIIYYKYTLEERINYALFQIEKLAEIYKIDLLWHIKHKMLYNASRPYKHGKAY